MKEASSVNINSPCLKCEERKMHCHSNCGRYDKYKAKVKAANEKRHFNIVTDTRYLKGKYDLWKY